MIFWLVPVIALLLAVAGVVTKGMLIPALVAIASSIVFWSAVSLGMRIPAWYGLVYPLGSLVVLFIVGRSTWRGAGKIEWKGRSYGSAADAPPP